MKVIVIGSGMVGVRFCELIKKYDTDQKIQLFLFGEEDSLPYDRVKLSDYFTNFNLNNLILKNNNWFEENSIFLIQEKVISIHPKEKLICSTKNSYSYDKLILATGSFPYVPNIEGINPLDLQFSCFNSQWENQCLFVYRTIRDLERIHIKAKESKNCVVVGGGLLGLEATKACLNLGLETSIIELENRLMPQQLDEEGGTLLARKVKEMGCHLFLKRYIKKIQNINNKLILTLNTEEILETDFVIFSVGIRPRDELARNAGIITHNKGGILVNSFMQTSDQDIYAIGEVALFDNKIYGLVSPGYTMAEVASKHILQFLYPSEKIIEFSHPFLNVKLKVIGLNVSIFGNPFAENTNEIKFKNEERFIYKKVLIDKDLKIQGGIFIGDLTNFSILSQISEEQSKSNGARIPISEIENLLFPQQNLEKRINFSFSNNTIICKCNNISKKEILDCIMKNNIDNLEILKTKCNVGTGCGGCISIVEEIFNSELKKNGGNPRKILCEHFPYTRQELFSIIKIKRYKTFKEVLKNYGQGIGCEICKPVVASILASLWNQHILNEDTIQDTNDKFLANIQKGGSYSIVPRIPGGEITPDKLIAIGKIAKEFNLYCKITGGQRIDLFGARLDDLPLIWEKLIQAGFESGHAYAKALRTVKSCVGSTWCRYGVQDSTSLAIKIENRYKGLRAPHKIKAAVSGCVRECAEAQSKDFGIIATEKGWNLYVCGNGGANPKHAVLFAKDLDEETLIQYIDRFLMFYIQTADHLTRTATWIEHIEGGIEYLQNVIINDSLGIASELEEMMKKSLENYQCEWKEAIKNSKIRNKFRTFINTDREDPSLQFVTVREQKIPLAKS